LDTLFPDDLVAAARQFLADCKAQGLHVATAESCTGGLLAGLLTEIPGSSTVVDRGFITYSNHAKNELLAVPTALLREHGAVSEPVARAMAAGALDRSHADLTVAITGIAGPAQSDTDKLVGLVHFAATRRGGITIHERHQFPDNGRAGIRLAAVRTALALLNRLV